MEQSKKTQIGALGRKVSDSTILMHEAIARKVGLTGVDHKYIGIILGQGSLTAGDLSNLTGLTTGAVTRIIDRLEKKKLVKREFDKNDRRKTLIVPDIEKTNKLFENAHLDLKTQIENLISSFDEKEILVIEKYLNRTIEIMNNITYKLNNHQNE